MEAHISISRPQAAQLYSVIFAMTGGVAFRAKREEFQKKIERAWPEILDKEPPALDAIDLEERRHITLNEREQKAMAEGLLALASKETANGADYKTCLDLARLLRLSSWFRKAVATEEIPEFTEPLDGEPDLLDAEEIMDRIESAGSL